MLHLDKKTIVFDLDETLMSSNAHFDDSPCDVKIPVVLPDGEVLEVDVHIRPHAKEILKNLSRDFEIIVYTASNICYGSVVMDYLDPNK